jgi:mannosyltransferase OCH1-like enzyme
MSGETEALRRLIEEWAAANPRVRRVWISEDATEVAVAPCPVADSEETLPVWIAHCDAWRLELLEVTGLLVRLDLLDPDRG